MSDVSLGILQIEIDPKALEHLRKKGSVYVLTDVQNPQYSYYKIKGFKGDLKVTFEEFVEVCKMYGEAQGGATDLPVEFEVRVFNVSAPSSSNPSNLGFYLVDSGFAKVEDWLKSLKEEDIPECESGHRKTFYLYHIETAT